MEKKKNVFEDFINSLEEIDGLSEVVDKTKDIPQDDSAQIFINELMKMYGIDFSYQDRQSLAVLIRFAEQMHQSVSQTLVQSGFNVLLVNELALYNSHKKSLEEVALQIFLYGVAFGGLDYGYDAPYDVTA